MKLGIDASNLRRGGGQTHLIEVLRIADPPARGFNQVIVWGSNATLSSLEPRPWLILQREPLLDRPLPYRFYWQRFNLTTLLRQQNIDLLFVPGGFYIGPFRPYVTMSQNLLPFQWSEYRRYGFSLVTMRYFTLRYLQTISLRRANGVIFLTNYARQKTMNVVKNLSGLNAIIPHGINSKFEGIPRPQKPISTYTTTNPFCILYISIINVYKHQWHVVEAISQLRAAGYPVELKLVGPAYPPALKRLNLNMSKFDPAGEFINYLGAVPYNELQQYYLNADLFVFASSCETFGMILAESMRAGLPIACSNMSAMPELLGEAGIYFNPEDPDSIANAIIRMIKSPELRAKKAEAAFNRARQFSWSHCAEMTFTFLEKVLHRYSHSNRAIM